MGAEGGGSNGSPTLLKQGEAAPDVVFLAGCSEEQITLPFDYRILLTAPAETSSSA